MPFSKALVRSAVSSRIWIQVADSISYYDKHYTNHNSLHSRMSEVLQYFHTSLLATHYSTWPKQFKPCEVPALVYSIVVVGALILCVIWKPHRWTCHSLIQEFMLYKFKLAYNTMEAIKNIYCRKEEGTVDHCTVTRWFKKLC